MSQLLQRNFLKIRNDFIIPIAEESDIKIREYQHLKLKNAIFDNFTSVTNPSDNDYQLIAPKSIINKAKISEIEQFYIRAKFQDSDFDKLTDSGTSSWLFTTQYYNLFFLAACMQRLLNKGYFWIGTEDVTNLSFALSTHLNSMINLGSGNYRFVIENYDDYNYKVFISKQGANTHQQTWTEIKSTIKDFIENSSGEEKDFLEKLRSTYNSIYGFSPPSTRNEINYNSKTSIEEMDNKIYCNKIKFEKIDDALEKIKLNSRENNDKIKLTSIMTVYFSEMLSKLLGELASRKKNSCRLISKYERIHGTKIIQMN